MDLLRVCYRGQMRFYRDACEELAEVVWYFTDRTDFIQNNVYVSSLYDDVHDSDGDPVGEVGGRHAWRDGWKVPPQALQGPQPCGRPDQWAGNLYLADAAPRNACPVCTLQGRGNLGVRGAGGFFRQRQAGSGKLGLHGGACRAGRGCLCLHGQGQITFVVPSSPCLSATVRPRLRMPGPCLCGTFLSRLRMPGPCLCAAPGAIVKLLGPVCLCGKAPTGVTPPIPPATCIPWWPSPHPAATVTDPDYGLGPTVWQPNVEIPGYARFPAWVRTYPDGTGLYWTFLNSPCGTTFQGVPYFFQAGNLNLGQQVDYSAGSQTSQWTWGERGLRVTGRTVTILAPQ